MFKIRAFIICFGALLAPAFSLANSKMSSMSSPKKVAEEDVSLDPMFNLTKFEVGSRNDADRVLIYQKLQKTGSTHLEALLLSYARANDFTRLGIYKASSQFMTENEQVINFVRIVNDGFSTDI